MAIQKETATNYLEKNVFPTLLPGMEAMLQTATATERRKRFNPLDYVVEYLYRYNPKHDDRNEITLPDIPFVKDEWKRHPRPPLPLSATLTEEEAAIQLQAAYRGYQVRSREDVEIFREWQKSYHEEIYAVQTIQRYCRQYLSRKQELN